MHFLDAATWLLATTLIFLLGVPGIFPSISLANTEGLAISNVQVGAISPGTAVVTWQTSLPSTSQVVLTDSDYAAESASPTDPSLLTDHQVILPVRPGASYTYYVVSGNQAAVVSSKNASAKTSFIAAPINTGGTLDYRVDTYGAHSVYHGHDLYVGISSVLLAGTTGHLYFNPPSGLPPGATFHVICAYNSNILNESADSWWDAGRQYCYNGNNESVVARIRTSDTTPPGIYTLGINTNSSGGLQRTVTFRFTVLGPPQTILASPTTIPTIPGLDTWQQKMTTLGQQWCNPSEQMSFGYEPQIWYYDGGRTYFQISEFMNQPSTWEPCALNISSQYRDYALAGGVPGWRVFPHGLAMNYWRTGDAKSRDAVIALANGSAYAHSQGGVGPDLIRETAYLIDTWTLTERLGLPHDSRLDRAVDFGIGQIDQILSGNGTVMEQPFMDGLMAEALIQYYELTQDPRIPPVIKQLLDHVWVSAWNSSSQLLAYNTVDVPINYNTGLNLLLAPAFAWYWALTGDPVYQQRGDALFSSGINQDISYSGKIYNQNYRWSFDYVRWRQQGALAPSFLAGAGATTTQGVLAVSGNTVISGGSTKVVKLWLKQVAQQDTVVTLSDASGILKLPSTVAVMAGALFNTFNVTALDVSQVTSATSVASLNGSSTQTRFIVTPAAWGTTDIASVWSRPTMTVGTSDDVTVFLTSAAPPGGIPVKLTSSDRAVLSVPASVTVPAGAKQVSVSVTLGGATTRSTTVVVQGTVVTTKEATVQVTPRASKVPRR